MRLEGGATGDTELIDAGDALDFIRRAFARAMEAFPRPEQPHGVYETAMETLRDLCAKEYPVSAEDVEVWVCPNDPMRLHASFQAPPGWPATIETPCECGCGATYSTTLPVVARFRVEP